VGEELQEPWLEWLDGISNQHAVAVLAKLLTPELIKVAASERRDVLIYATVNVLPTLVSFVNACKMGFYSARWGHYGHKRCVGRLGEM
jgi:hypothetical protein